VQPPGHGVAETPDVEHGRLIPGCSPSLDVRRRVPWLSPAEVVRST
jgi:hypothetical protein